MPDPIAIALIAGTAISLPWCGWRLWLASVSVRWPVVEGEVISSSFEDRGVLRSEDRYQIRIVYRYKVNGEIYESSTLAIGQSNVTNQVEEAEIATEKYRVGTKVAVYFDPTHPSTSVLDRGRTRHAWGQLFVVLVVLALLWNWYVQDHLGN